MKDYYNVCANSDDPVKALASLDDAVKTLISTGWVPEGGASIVYNSKKDFYTAVQTITKYHM